MTSTEQLADTIPPPSPTPAEAFPKACACGRSYDALAWTRLHLVGFQDDGDGGEVELRDCLCGSTIGIEVRRG